jgi:hypothetical protein
MNYLKVYCNFIRKAENRTLPEGYTEKHHIFPVSIYGKNNRLVVLTAREHYIAHALLEKIYIKRYGLNHWKTKKMIHAFWKMNTRKNEISYSNSILYEYSKINHSKQVSMKMMGNKHSFGVIKSKETIEKLRKANTGKKCKEETKRKISESLKGWTPPPKSEETKRKMSDSKKGKKFSEAHKNNLKKSWEKRKSKMSEDEIKKYFQTTKNRRWFSNDDLKITKMFYPTNVPTGWTKGRKKY